MAGECWVQARPGQAARIRSEAHRSNKIRAHGSSSFLQAVINYTHWADVWWTHWTQTDARKLHGVIRVCKTQRTHKQKKEDAVEAKGVLFRSKQAAVQLRPSAAVWTTSATTRGTFWGWVSAGGAYRQQHNSVAVTSCDLAPATFPPRPCRTGKEALFGLPARLAPDTDFLCLCLCLCRR
jgi:hypothetical protein